MTRSIRSANAEFQVLEALRVNRQKRNRENAFVVEGVRNVDAAFAHRWTVRSVLVSSAAANRSAWAQGVLGRADDVVELAAPLFDALTDREEPPELLLVVDKRALTLADVAVDNLVATVLDRPASPGNIGTIVRSADALGSGAVVVVGHAADPYDPRAVRASTGSFFAVPVVEVASPDDVIAWAGAHAVALVATDEAGDVGPDAIPTPPIALLFGNEKSGLSRTLRDAADVTVAIPMTGSASSLNIAAAHAVALFSARRG